MSHLSDETLQALADHTLQGEARIGPSQHAAGCARCQAQLAEYRALFEGLADLSVPPPPPRFTAQVMSRVAEREAENARQRRLALVTLGASAALAFGCFALAGNAAWARHLTLASSNMLQLAELGRAMFHALAPVLAALRLQLVALAAAVCIPTLLVLHRSLAPRGQAL